MKVCRVCVVWSVVCRVDLDVSVTVTHRRRGGRMRLPRAVGMKLWLVGLLLSAAEAYVLPKVPEILNAVSCDRRRVIHAATTVATAAVVLPGAAIASGGATSGKTTSIPRAKLRYYGRVSAAISRFEAVEQPLKDGNVKGALSKFYGESYETQDGSMATAFEEVRGQSQTQPSLQTLLHRRTAPTPICWLRVYAGLPIAHAVHAALLTATCLRS